MKTSEEPLTSPSLKNGWIKNEVSLAKTTKQPCVSSVYECIKVIIPLSYLPSRKTGGYTSWLKMTSGAFVTFEIHIVQHITKTD